MIYPQTYEVLKIQGTEAEEEYYDYTIQLRLNQNCNLNCSYCHWKDGKLWNFEDIIKIIDNIKVLFDYMNFKSTKIFIHGGESTIHPKFMDILKYIKDTLGSVIELQTNLTMDISKWDEYIDQYSVSLHYGELLRTGKMKMFTQNLDKIKELYHFDIMLEKVDDKEKYYNFILKYLNKAVESEFIYNYMGGYNCYEDHKDFIDKYNKTTQEYLINNKIYNTNDLFENVNFKGMTCFETSQQTFINGDGNVSICPSGVPSGITEGDVWFNILTDKHFLIKFKVIYTQGFKCKWNQCLGCFYSDKIRKD